jgi:response regulator NasT
MTLPPPGKTNRIPAVRILLADDESIIRMDLKEALEAAGHQIVGEAADGKEAVALAEALQPDAILLDIKMPRMTGLAAAAKIKSAPCVILTAYKDAKTIAKARKSGAYTFLVKPYKESELLAALELAAARFDEKRALEAELADSRGKLEARKLIDRAKGVLMDRHGLKEGDAFRLLQKRSMDTRRTIVEVAKEILAAGKQA